jgi:hypothetical protein
MAVVNCNFTVIPAANGGKLSGNGFNGVPSLNAGDSLQVVVRWGGPNPPTQVTGYWIVSPAASAGSQSTPSPFVNGGKFVCYGTASVGQDANNPTYTFAPLAYGGSQPGNYELTFVVEDGSTSPPTQYSEDPEFDTGN